MKRLSYIHKKLFGDCSLRPVIMVMEPSTELDFMILVRVMGSQQE
jgi:hypothetical protein